MPRKKKQDQELQKVEVNNNNHKEFVYCEFLKCPHTECLRHNKNTPYNVVIYRRKFNPDKEWNCKDKIINITKE